MSGCTCAECGLAFDYDPGWTQEDVLAEAAEHGWDVQVIDGLVKLPMVVVCDECYVQIMAWNGIAVDEARWQEPAPKDAKVEP